MNNIELYQAVADAYHAQGKYQERDRFLVLAMDAAHTSAQYNLAEQIRGRLLQLNPNHLMKPYPDCSTAIQSPNFSTYLQQLRKNFPPAATAKLLNELGGQTTAKPKPTMLATPSFPAAEPVEEQLSPTWSTINIESKARTIDLSMQRPTELVEPIFRELPPASKPMHDPLADIPVSPQPPIPFQQERPISKPPTSVQGQRPVIVPVPASSNRRQREEHASGVWIGNLLFVVLFLASMATLAYVFVLPFYPEVAKMLKGAM